MKKINVLAWGMKHIAGNYGFDANVDYKEDGAMCIYGGCRPAALSDVHLLCEDLGIQREYVEASEFGITVYINWDWTQEGGLLQQDYAPTGMELWKRKNATIMED